MKLGYILNKLASKTKQNHAYLSWWTVLIKSFIKIANPTLFWIGLDSQHFQYIWSLFLKYFTFIELSHHSLYQLQTNKSIPHFTVNVILNCFQRGSGYICFKDSFPPSFYHISIIFSIELFIEGLYCSSHYYFLVNAIKGIVGGV